MVYQIVDSCIACGVCEAECLHGAIHVTGSDSYAIDPRLCQCDGIELLRCREVCPVGAIQPADVASGSGSLT
jgi:MinD superfamily P-loop ATPase